MGRKLKILIYYTHKESLGHTSRITTLANAFARMPGRRFQVYLLQAGIPQPHIAYDREIEKIDVPYPFYSKAQFKNLPVDIRNMDIRAEFIFEKARTIMPDILMTEYFPFGRSECFLELSKTFLLLKNQKKKIFATIGYPYITLDVIKNTHRFFQYTRFYDKIFIHTPEHFEYPFFIDLVPDEERKQLYESIFTTLREKIIHTGYIFPEYEEGLTHVKAEKLTAPWKRPGRTRLLVSRGGGTTCPKIIASSILAQKYLDGKCAMLLSCGPATGKKELAFFKDLIRKNRIKNTTVVPYLPHFGKYLQSCDISISLAGYNTSVQLLRLGKKCIVIPYTVLAKSGWINDQTPRSHLLEKYLDARLFDYDELKSEPLALAIRQLARARAPKPLPSGSFQGAANTVKTVLTLL